MLTIVIPVKNPPNIDLFISENKKLFAKYQIVVIDSGGGEKLKEYSNVFIQKSMSLVEARKLGYSKAKTKYILNLDVDVVIPKGYIEMALIMLGKGADAVSIFYEDVAHCQGALEFGCSIWRTNVLRKLYDFSFEFVNDGKLYRVGPRTFATLNNGWCECTYMWRKLKENDYTLTTCAYRAKHLRVI